MDRRKWIISALASLLITLPALALEEGDPAPQLSIAKWVQGSQVTDLGRPGKHTYVLAFWATWSKPSKDSLSELADIQKEFKKADVVVIAVSDDSAGDVEKFLSGHPRRDSLGIKIAVDDDQKTTLAYMRAAGKGALPHVFVINKDGLLAWQGHPNDARDVLEQITAGTFAIRKEGEKTSVAAADPELLSRLDNAREAKNWKDALQLIEELLKLYPNSEEAEDQLSQKFTILYEELKDYSAAEKFAREVLSSPQDSARVFNNIAWTLLARGDLETLDNRWPAIAHQAARKAFDMSQGLAPGIVDTYSRSLYLLGYVEVAAVYQQQAVNLMKALIEATSEESNEEEMQALNRSLGDLTTALKYYEEVVETRNRLAP